MPLPSSHQWYNKTPTASDKMFAGCWIGASNLSVGSQTTTGEDYYNTNRNLLYKHNDTLVGFSDPPNQQSVSTYPSLKEAGTQNIVSFFSEEVRNKTDNKIVIGTLGHSGLGLLNQSTGFLSDTLKAEQSTYLQAFEEKIEKPLDYLCIAVSDGDMKFNPSAQDIVDKITEYVGVVRTYVSNQFIPVFIRLPGLVPTTQAVADLYPTWALHNTTLKTLSIQGVHLVDTDTLTVATYREADEIHGNAAGNKACAELFVDAMVSAGLLPKYN